MIAIGYTRRSTKGNESVVSLQEQARAIRAYCSLHDLTLLEPIVEDDGVSGADDSRLERLLSVLRARQASVLVVYHDDRLARSMVRVLDFIGELSAEGVAVHIVSRGVAEVDTSGGLLTTGVHALIAEYHRLLTKEKTTAALALLKSQGRRYSNVPPYGKEIKGKTLVDNEHERRLLGRLEELVREGLSIRRVSRALAADGFLSRSGRPLAPSTIHKLIRRELR